MPSELAGMATGDVSEPFVERPPMEDSLSSLFPGDCGVLEPNVRRVLARLLQRRFIESRDSDDWLTLLNNQHIIESRLNDVFIRLIVDRDRGVAYKEQVRSDELDIPILLKNDRYGRAETLVLVYLRALYQRESSADDFAPRVDIEDIEQSVLTYFSDGDGNVASRQKAIRSALDRLKKEGIVRGESEGRYSITPLIEIVMSAKKMHELLGWLKEQTAQQADSTETKEGDPS